MKLVCLAIVVAGLLSADAKLLPLLKGKYDVVHVTSEAHQFPFTSSSSTDAKDLYWIHPLVNEFTFQSSGMDVHMRIQKDNSLFGSRYVESGLLYKDGKYVGEEVNQRTVKDRACFYKAAVTVNGEAQQGEHVLNTCQGGFRSTFSYQNRLYALEPASNHMDTEELTTHYERIHQTQLLAATPHRFGSLHVVYEHSDLLSEEQKTNGIHWCGVTHEEEQAAGHAHEELGMESAIKATLAATKAAPANRKRVQTESLKIVELVVVNDYLRFKNPMVGNGINDGATEVDSVDIISRTAMIYLNNFMSRPTPIQVVLVGQYTFRFGDPYVALRNMANKVSVDSLLPKFQSWASSTTNLTAHDNRQLLSGDAFETPVLGYANVNGMCQVASSGGIDMTTVTQGVDNVLAGAVVAHEMGHNFGMLHDGPMNGNMCPDTGFIMNSVVGTPPTQFSSCSFVYENTWQTTFMSTCLDNTPTVVWGTPVCGNGWIEQGEQCDCGTANCASVGDNCCNGTSCMLLPGKQCSPSQLCCDNACMKRSAASATVCRASVGVCDIAEVCDGVSADCPADLTLGAGNTCNDPTYGAGVCYAGACTSLQRDCRIKGASISMPPPPYDACGSPSPSSGDGFCSKLQCKQHSGGSCLSFTGGDGDNIPVTDGVACGSGRQCLLGQCVDSAGFNPRNVWKTGNWLPCTSCDTPQFRNVSCFTNTNNFLSIPQPDGVCSPANKPSNQQACQDVNPPCVTAPNDNDFDRLARELAEKYGALDKAKSIRDAVPRWPGYPTEFSTTDPQYRKGIELMAIVPFILAGVALIVWILWCCVLQEKADNKADLSIPAGGYSNCQRYGFWAVVLVLVVFMVIWAALGLFYNGELRRGCCESSSGATHLMNQILDDTIALTGTLANPLQYINNTLYGIVQADTPRTAAIMSDMAPGTAAVSYRLSQVAAKWNGYTASQPAYGTYITMPQSFPCVYCSMLTTRVTASNVELATIAGGMAAVGAAANNITAVLYAIQARFWFDNDAVALAVASSEVASVGQQAMDQKTLAQETSDRAEQADRYFHPFCIVFLAFVPLILVISVLGGTCFKSSAKTAFGYSVHMNFWMIVGSLLLLGGAIPLMAVTGDSCEYLNKAEANIAGTLNISVAAGRIIQSCLTDTPISDALNLTEVLLGTSNLNFPAIPAVSFATTSFSALVSEGASRNVANVFPAWNLNSVINDLQAMSDITYPVDGKQWGRDNYTTIVVADYPGQETMLTDIQSAVTGHIAFEFTLSNVVDWLKQNMTQAQTDFSALSSQTSTDITDYNSMRSDPKLMDLHNAGATVIQNNNCGAIGDDYHGFKTAWCDVITTSFSFLALAFFLIALTAIPTLILSRKLAWRMPPDNSRKMGGVSDVEVADSNY